MPHDYIVPPNGNGRGLSAVSEAPAHITKGDDMSYWYSTRNTQDEKAFLQEKHNIAFMIGTVVNHELVTIAVGKLNRFSLDHGASIDSASVNERKSWLPKHINAKCSEGFLAYRDLSHALEQCHFFRNEPCVLPVSFKRDSVVAYLPESRRYILKSAYPIYNDAMQRAALRNLVNHYRHVLGVIKELTHGAKTAGNPVSNSPD